MTENTQITVNNLKETLTNLEKTELSMTEIVEIGRTLNKEFTSDSKLELLDELRVIFELASNNPVCTTCGRAKGRCLCGEDADIVYP